MNIFLSGVIYPHPYKMWQSFVTI